MYKKPTYMQVLLHYVKCNYIKQNNTRNTMHSHTIYIVIILRNICHAKMSNITIISKETP